MKCNPLESEQSCPCCPDPVAVELLERLAALADIAALKAETNWNPDHFEMTDDANEARALAARLKGEDGK